MGDIARLTCVPHSRESEATASLASDNLWTCNTTLEVADIDFYFRERANRPYQLIERSSGITGGYCDSTDGAFGKVAH